MLGHTSPTRERGRSHAYPWLRYPTVLPRSRVGLVYSRKVIWRGGMME